MSDFHPGNTSYSTYHSFSHINKSLFTILDSQTYVREQHLLAVLQEGEGPAARHRQWPAHPRRDGPCDPRAARLRERGEPVARRGDGGRVRPPEGVGVPARDGERRSDPGVLTR